MARRKQPRRSARPERRASSWQAPAWLPWALMAAAIVLGAVLRFANLEVKERSPDEKVYTYQAKIAGTQGIEGTRNLVKEFLATPQLHLYPPPTRTGFIFLLAAMQKASGRTDPDPGGLLSCLASIAAMLAAAALGWRFMGRWATVAGLFLLAVFPPDLVIARRCWTDASSAFLGVAMLYFTLRLWEGPASRAAAVLLPAAGAASVLVKELGVLFYAPCLVLAAWALWKRGDRGGLITLAGSAVATTAIATVLMATSCGGLSTVLQILAGEPAQNATNDYALTYASGPGYLLLEAFWRMSPLAITLAIPTLLAVVIRRKARPTLIVMAWITIATIGIYMVVPHWLNLRYASAAFAPLCLFAGYAACRMVDVFRESGASAANAAIGVVAALWLVCGYGDYQRFEHAFVKLQAADLTTKLVFDALDASSRAAP